MKRTILVVDDDDDIRSVIAGSLRTTTGWWVIEAYCGSQGIESARERQPDAILLDLALPAMNGTEILRRLKANRTTAHIPIVILTAKSDCSSLGVLPVEAILHKPFDPLRLAGEVSAALGWPPASHRS